MSAQFKDGAIPIDSAISRVFEIQGTPARHFLSPVVILEPDEFYGAITSSYLTDVRQKLSQLLTLPSIAIRFGKVTEGRPYSLALRLRELGYSGELHAVGAVNAEMMHHLIRVGFSHAHLDASVSLVSKSIISPFSFSYQRLGFVNHEYSASTDERDR